MSATLNSCVLAIHACGEGIFTKMVSTVQSNPDASTSSVCGGHNQSYMNRYNPTGTAGGRFASLDQFMTCGWSCNTKGVAPPTKYVGTTNTGDGVQVWRVTSDEYSTMTNAGMRSGNSPTYTVTGKSGQSSFGNMNQMMLGNMLGGPLANLFKGFGTTQPSSNTTGTIQNSPPPAATLSITAAPPSIKKGENIAVNWTSNATLLNPPCQVTQNGTVISQANAGNRTITTSSSTPATLTFVLMCKAAQNGQTVEQRAVVNVQ